MIDLLRNRRSIRKYKPTPIETAKKSLLKEAILRSPTSRNLRPCEFIFVENQQVLKQLSTSKPHGAAFLKDAPLGVVVCADENISDVWVEDASIACILLQLTAQSLGLGSCWIQIRKRIFRDTISSEQHVKDLLNLPENFKVEAIIAIGYPGEQHPPVPFDSLKNEKIREITN